MKWVAEKIDWVKQSVCQEGIAVLCLLKNIKARA